MRGRLAGVLVACAVALGAAAAPAAALTFAPPETPGPALSVPPAKLAAALTCSPGLAGAKRAPVLLVQGTGATAKDNWSWTYEPGLDKLGIPWCQVDLPDHADGDVQVNGEYVVHAIREMHARSGRRIAILGHSQGGMVPRWALRFWPDTRAMVDDVIGFAPSNHGTTQAAASCGQGSCSPAGWQQWDVSNFMKALNSYAETWRGISYTNVYTHTDEIVQPNSDDHGSSSLHTGAGRITNVATQEICPTDPYEHLLIGLVDPVAYALAVDALDHDGPADPARVGLAPCAQLFQPGNDPATMPVDGAEAAIDYGTYQAAEVDAEPPLACYTTATCPAPAKRAAGTRPSQAPRCTSRSRFTLRLRALRHARATLGGRRAAVKRRGRWLYVTVDLRRTGTRRVSLRVRGRDARGRAVTIARSYRRCPRL